MSGDVEKSIQLAEDCEAGYDEARMATMAYAIFWGSLSLVQHVINERGFDCNAPNTSRTNVLEMAVPARQLKIVQYLVGEEPMDLAQDSSEPGGSIYDLAVSLDPTSFR